MAGQQERKFTTTPDMNSPAPGADPTVRTQGFQASAARVQGDGAQLGAIGNALSGFFGGVNRAVATVGETIQREDLYQIDRENKALAKQGQIDHKLGNAQDPRFNDRQSYYEAYQNSAADQSAAQLSDLLKDRLSVMKLDGSEDPQAITEQFYKDHVGKGTGDREYDDRLLAQFGKQAQAQVHTYREGVRSTVEQNTTQAIINNAAQAILKGEMTSGKLAVIRDQVAAVAHGDVRVADQILLAATASVQNDGQAISVLQSMKELGMAEQYPDQFNKVSAQMLDRTNKVKTFDAGQAIQRYQMEMMQERQQYPHGILPPERVAEYAKRWFGIDSVHGVGLHGGGLQQAFNTGVQKEAAVNLWSAAKSGQYETQDSARVAAAHGKSPGTVLSEHYDSAIAAEVEKSTNFPQLRASKDGTGLIDPMKDDGTIKEFVAFTLDPGNRRASQDTISDTYKASIGQPLLGNDPVKMARSFEFYRGLMAGGVTDAQMSRYFPNSEAENAFRGMYALSRGSRGIAQITRDLADPANRLDAQAIQDGAKTGRWNFQTLSGLRGTKPGEIDTKITDARNKAFRGDVGRQQWFLNADVGMGSQDLNEFDGLLADQMLMQKRVNGGKVDIDLAVESVAATLKGRYLALPAMDGSLQLMKDPFAGKGRTVDHPLNEDPSHPLSISKGYPGIYAGFALDNKLGSHEDPLVTFKEDAKTFSKSFKGLVKNGDPDNLWLERPTASGLSKVKMQNGMDINLMAGQKYAMPVKRVVDNAAGGAPSVADADQLFGAASLSPRTFTVTEDKAVEIPKDPKAAAEFFRKTLPPGWYAQPSGYTDPEGHPGYSLYYGMRVKGDQKAQAAATATRANNRARAIAERGKPATGFMQQLNSMGAFDSPDSLLDTHGTP